MAEIEKAYGVDHWLLFNGRHRYKMDCYVRSVNSTCIRYATHWEWRQFVSIAFIYLSNRWINNPKYSQWSWFHFSIRPSLTTCNYLPIDSPDWSFEVDRKRTTIKTRTVQYSSNYSNWLLIIDLASSMSVTFFIRFTTSSTNIWVIGEWKLRIAVMKSIMRYTHAHANTKISISCFNSIAFDVWFDLSSGEVMEFRLSVNKRNYTRLSIDRRSSNQSEVEMGERKNDIARIYHTISLEKAHKSVICHSRMQSRSNSREREREKEQFHFDAMRFLLLLFGYINRYLANLRLNQFESFEPAANKKDTLPFLCVLCWIPMTSEPQKKNQWIQKTPLEETSMLSSMKHCLLNTTHTHGLYTVYDQICLECCW